MCDIDHLAEMDAKGAGVSRRQFTRMGVVLSAGAAAACAPVEGDVSAAEGALRESMVSFDAPGATMDAFFVHPASGKYPAVILWPDIAGLRDSKKAMARRLASEGYAVIVPNPFYRSLPAPQFADFNDFRDNDGFQKVGPWMAENSHDNVTATAKAVVAWLDGQSAVDTARGIGNQGYCMGGPFTVRTAAAVPSRVKAIASFHGGGLVGDDADAPINLFDDLADDVHMHLGIAQNDDARAPDDKTKLRAMADQQGVTAEIIVYAGDHGWTVLDSPAYDEAAAEKAYANLLALYAAAL